MDRSILIIAGEPSGDLHAANLVSAVRATHPDIRFYGTGGDRMTAAGVECIHHVRDMSVLGLVEVLKHLPYFRGVMRDCLALARSRKPDLVILVDYPGFNLRLAAALKKQWPGLPVLYYIAPQVWAWGTGRVRKMKRLIDRMAVILPFEKAFFASHGIPSDYIGHPLVDAVTPATDAGTFRRAHGIPEGTDILGLMPGSRIQEVRTILPVMLQAARDLRKRTGIRPVIGASPNIPAAVFEALLPDDADIPLCTGGAYDVMHHSRLVLTASGSATLEIAYAGTPMFILYRVAALTWLLGRLLVNLPYIGLVNIVAGRSVVPEYLQGRMDARTITADAEALLADKERYRAMQQALGDIRKRLGSGTPARNGAQIVLDMLGTA